MTDTISTIWKALEEGSEAINVKDVRTELIETVWTYWINSLSDENVDKRHAVRQMVADFSSVLAR